MCVFARLLRFFHVTKQDLWLIFKSFFHNALTVPGRSVKQARMENNFQVVTSLSTEMNEVYNSSIIQSLLHYYSLLHYNI